MNITHEVSTTLYDDLVDSIRNALITWEASKGQTRSFDWQLRGAALNIECDDVHINVTFGDRSFSSLTADYLVNRGGILHDLAEYLTE